MCRGLAQWWELPLVLGTEGFACTLLFWQFQLIKEILQSTWCIVKQNPFSTSGSLNGTTNKAVPERSPAQPWAQPVISAFPRSHSAMPGGCQGSPALPTCRATGGPCPYLWSRQQDALPEGWAQSQPRAAAEQHKVCYQVQLNPALCRSGAPYSGRIATGTCKHTLMTRFLHTVLRRERNH